MLRAIGFALAAGCWLGLAQAQAQEPARLYVAVDGNDGAAGTAEAPFATLEKARDEIRARRAAGSPGAVEVIVKGGTYERTAPFELTKEDSGAEGAGVVYRAEPGAQVRISGGKAVADWQPVPEGPARERLDAAVRDKVVQADLKAAGVTDFGSADGSGLAVYYRDRMMTIARWPNQGFTNIADIVVQDDHQIHGIKGSKVGRFKYEGDRPKRWVGEKDPWLHGYWFWDWSDQRQAVASIDVEKGEIAVKEPYHNYGYRKGQWYYAFNMLSELDAPGEWYLDRETGVLYFYPPEAVKPGEVVVSIAPMLVTMKDVSHVTLRGLTLEAARKQAVSVSNGTHVLVAGCTIRNIGDSGVGMSGTESGVVGCDLYRLGGTGISLSGGDRVTLTPAGLFADNNHIHDYGQWFPMYNPGIALNGVGNRATHNLIHDAPHMAIQFWGNDHLMEFNEIYRVCMESNDAGAIYSGRNWTMRGTVIRNNYLHDITGFRQGGCVGVYLDDMFCGTEISSNVFLRVTRAAFIGGGRDVHIENNVFVDCSPAVHVDARALNWAGYHADEWVKEANEKGTLQEIAYNKPPYSEKYPELVNIIQDEPKAPKGNVIARNICVGGKWDEIEGAAQPLLKIENNLLDADPLFVDAAKQDYRLKKDSPAYALGFKDIPMEKIGLYTDEYRESTAGHAERWTENQIKSWYAQQPWLVGANFGPSTAINQLEMWQADTFDPATIDRELGWAEGLGMNTMRVFLHNLPWKEDAEGFCKRIDEFLTIADKHKIRPLFVPLDDVWDPHPQPGKQRDPKPGVHNSGWVQAPGAEILSNPSRHGEIEAYIKGLLTRFGKDRRVLAWDLYNEPGNTNNDSYGPQEPPNKGELSLVLITKVFAAAREAAPEQPLTAGVWTGSFDDPAKMLPLTRFMLENSDFISFHSYGKLDDVKRIVEILKQHGRPVVCTEYMSRSTGSTFEAILPYLKEQNVAAYNWGLVAGKTQTIYPWDSWKKPYAAEPELWFHDIFRADGSLYKPEEATVIRQLTGKAQ